MTMKRTQVGQEVEAALSEVLAHVRGKADLPCRIVDDPAAEPVRKRMKLSRRHRPVRPSTRRRAGMNRGGVLAPPVYC